MRISGKLFLILKSALALSLLLLAFYGSRFPHGVTVCVTVAAALSVAWEIRLSCRRMRPRRRMGMAAAVFAGVAGAFALIIVAVLEDREPGWEWMTGGFASLSVVCTAGAVWSFFRMRRLCAAARQRLLELQRTRRRRATSVGRGIYR